MVLTVSYVRKILSYKIGINYNRDNSNEMIIYNDIVKKFDKYYVYSIKNKLLDNTVIIVDLSNTFKMICDIPVIRTSYNLIENIDIHLKYNNIRLFDESIEKYKNILFICTDYPNWGGAATNTYEMMKYYKLMGKTVNGIFIHNEKINNVFEDITILKESSLIQYIRAMKNKPDLVILRNFINVNIKNEITCPIYFMIPGIFLPNLDKYYYDIKNKNEMDKYVHPGIFKTIRLSDISFSASLHTKELLEKFYNIKIYSLDFNYIPFYKQKIHIVPNWNSRKYDVGVIVSDFKRKVKNCDKIINSLIGKKIKVILIGKNCKKYEKYNFKCLELITRSEVLEYMKKIKYIIQDSFYESCSNVTIEAKYSGCKVIRNISMVVDEPINKHKILISSTQYTGYGGAATNAYAIVKYLRNEGYNVAGLFLHTSTNVNYNPDNIEGIFISTYNRPYEGLSVRDNIIDYLKGPPSICFGKNYIAPIVLKSLFPNSYITYLVSGINHLNSTNIPAVKFLSDPSIMGKVSIPDEIECIEKSNLIVLNSLLCKNIFEKLYPYSTSKIYPSIIDTTQYLNMDMTNQDKLENNNNIIKEYDIMVCCSRLDRIVKNNGFLIDVLNDNRLNYTKKCIIGQKYDNFENIPNSVCLGLLKQDETNKFMKKCKLLLFPSLFDANPNTVREALKLGCIPIITPNIGFSELFPDVLICQTFEKEEWINKILYNLNNFENIKNLEINFSSNSSITDIINLV